MYWFVGVQFYLGVSTKLALLHGTFEKRPKDYAWFETTFNINVAAVYRSDVSFESVGHEISIGAPATHVYFMMRSVCQEYMCIRSVVGPLVTYAALLGPVSVLQFLYKLN